MLSSIGALINNGRITVSNGDTLFLAEANAALINSIKISDATLDIATQVTGGTIHSPTADIVLGGTLSGVTVDGTLTIDDAGENGTSLLTGGTSFAGADGKGSGVLDFANGGLTISGSSILDNVTINNAGGLYVSGPYGTFTLGAHAVLNAGEGTDLYAQGSLINDGTINIANPAADVSIWATTFTNDGAINLSGGGTLNVNGAGSTKFVNSVNVTNGTLQVAQAFNVTSAMTLQAGETLDLQGGGTLASKISGRGTLLLNTSNDFTIDPGTSILATLALYGTFLTLAAGVDFKLAAGSTWIGDGNIVGPANSAVTIDGTLINGGSFGVHVLDAGLVDVAADQAVLFGNDNAGAVITGTLTGAGTAYVTGTAGLDILPGATFDIDNVVQSGGPVVFGKSVAHTVTAQQTWLLEDAHIGGAAGASFVNDGTFSNSGTALSSVSIAFTNLAQINVGSGTLQFLGPLTNGGTITAAGGDLIASSNLSGTGTIDIGAPPFGHNGAVSGTAELHAVAVGQTIDFLTSTGTLLLDAPAKVLGYISNFSAGDTITLAGINETSFTYAKGLLSIIDNSATVAKLAFNGAYTQQSFTINDTSAGNVVITHT